MSTSSRASAASDGTGGHVEGAKSVRMVILFGYSVNHSGEYLDCSYRGRRRGLGRSHKTTASRFRPLIQRFDPASYLQPVQIRRSHISIPRWRDYYLYFDALPSTIPPLFSPYGDGWDVLWLGHCGVNFPNTELADAAQKSKNLPKGRVVHLNDETVPEPKYLKMLAEYEDPVKIYPPHSRIVHHAMGSICSLAYAVTQASARQILYDMGIKSFEAPFDLMLRDYCQGSGVRSYHPCLTVQPQLFNHHRPAGNMSSYSDISDHGTEYREKPSTDFIRWSARMNLERYLSGEKGYEDQFPDGS